ncbi:5730_t:CDS:2 [Ambispora gerdemannii]|uniref:5730_t:CDS:1 n=1 Tax=Ambispora gerdemannii TaxID=144530 RepID=A0A9N8W817_9GLOM|nr:5730_t:CDS:2 [Ambispora gerdemannii]
MGAGDALLTHGKKDLKADALVAGEDFNENEEEVIRSDEAMETICSVYTKQHPDDDLIDFQSLVPTNVDDFLVGFFSQDLTATEWQNKVDDLQYPDQNDHVMVAERCTLPQLIKVFSLGAYNPLLSIATIESAHHNAFVHPCLDIAKYITNMERFYDRCR